jgi:isopentenyl diphosphate isomerase/L-lactate dehydrogenase-like FMN-dependent dehydrogenase
MTVRAIRNSLTIDDLRTVARRRLPKLVFDFIDGGARDEGSLADNRRAFDAWHLMPRVGVDVSRRQLGTTLLGRPIAVPLVLGPTGLAGLYRPRGEMLACRAAVAAGIPFCLSTNSIASIEAVASDVPDGDRWFQLYPLRDRDLMEDMLRPAAENGYKTLCFTVDLPIQGRRERDVRNGFTLPLRPTVRTAWDVIRRPAWLYGLGRNPVSFGNFAKPGAGERVTSIAQHVATLFDPSADWSLIAQIRKGWNGPFVVKGIMHPDDARAAVRAGADAVIVSNHGGRQLDAVQGTCAALPGVVAAVAGQAEVMLDGGIRRGTDILKALALGARACMIGRPFLWGLAAAGEEGVRRAIGILAAELDEAMALAGVCDLAEISTDFVRARNH